MILATTQLRQLVGAWRLEVPTGSEDVGAFKLDHQVTARRVESVLRGISTPSVDWAIRTAADRSAAGTLVVSGTTSSTTTGDTETAFSSPTIPAGNWVWLETTAVGGTVLEFNLVLLA